MVLDFSFKTLQLQKLYAGTNKNNISSNFNLINNGFSLEKKTENIFSFVLLKRNFKKKIKYEIYKFNSIS
jgi:RimJ/RimL family protein N-acetyltransferase